MNILHEELQAKPINPNRSPKRQAVGISLIGVLFAILTVKSNYDYFVQYYEGWALFVRLVAFASVEITIITLPLFKGWGNYRQVIAFIVFEVMIAVPSLVHTALVSDVTQTRISANRSKAEAKTDYEAIQQNADEVGKRNTRRVNEYQQAMAAYKNAVRFRQQTGIDPGPPPEAPRLEKPPEAGNDLISTATMDIEQKVEESVPHRFLLRLLYFMVLMVGLAWSTMTALSDAVRVRMYLLFQRSQTIDSKIGKKKDVQVLGDGVNRNRDPREALPMEMQGRPQAKAEEDPWQLPEPERPNAPRRQ